MTALLAAYRAVTAALDGDPLWGNRVYADRVPPADTHGEAVARPYVVVQWTGGGDDYRQQGVQHARVVLTVKCVADDMLTSLNGAGRIEGLLRDEGDQEGGGLVAVEGWTVTTVSQAQTVHLVEAWQGTQPVYHDGHQYTLQMEKTT